MRSVLLASTALVAFAFGAQAADLPRRAAPPVYAAPVPVFTWTGFYIGANAGYGFGSRDNDDSSAFGRSLAFPAGNGAFFPGSGFTTTNPVLPNGTPFVVNPGTLAAPGTVLALGGGVCGFGVCSGNRRDGFVGGGQVGFNYQFTPGAGFVIGLEADAQYADLSRRDTNNVFGLGTFGQAAGPGIVGAPLFTNPVTIPAGLGPVTFFDPRVIGNGGGIDWFGTVRGRLGYAVDRFLVYGTGGFAYGGGGSENVNAFGYGGCFGDCNRTRLGWTAGGGVEYAITNNLSAKVEGLYVSLDRRSDTTFVGTGSIPYARDTTGVVYSAPAGAFSTLVGGRRDDSFAVVRAGLNYKFGFGAY